MKNEKWDKDDCSGEAKESTNAPWNTCIKLEGVTIPGQSGQLYQKITGAKMLQVAGAAALAVFATQY